MTRFAGLKKGDRVVYSSGEMKGLVWGFSLVHRTVCRVKNFFYSARIATARKAPLPVVSVGNIAFGGTGKTPLAQELLRFFSAKGLRPALVTRGYKGSWERRGGVLSDGAKILGTWKESGDEPFMVALDNPSAGVFVGKDRLRSLREAARRGFNIAVLDDGFQHRRLARDIDIVLYNPSEKAALREGPSSLSRAHIILVGRETGEAQKARLRARFPGIKIFGYSAVPRSFIRFPERQPVPVAEWKNKTVLAFCGIAGPERFFSLLRQTGVNIVSSLTFADHHPYPDESKRKIKEAYEEAGPDAVVTTEKDAVKLGGPGGLAAQLPLYCLKIGLEPDAGFWDHLMGSNLHI
jgi:tetraacyldisaccharide 4'-kinase